MQANSYQRIILALVVCAFTLLGGCAQFGQPDAPEPPSLYLRGDFNDWFSAQDKFERSKDPGLWIVTKQLSPGEYQFLISDRDGSCQKSLGNQQSRSVISDSAFTLSPCLSSESWTMEGNSLTLQVPEAATYHFTLKPDSQPPRLVVVKGRASES